MKKSILKLLKRFLPKIALDRLNEYLGKKIYKEWLKQGCPVPPPHIVKQKTIESYQQKYGYTILIETGTSVGNMVEAQKKRFKKVISIELYEDIFKKAQKRFKNDKNVFLVQGDSGKILSEVLSDLSDPAIFWLDGHCSGPDTALGEKMCPIFEEVDAIFNNNDKHILLIDDARDFVRNKEYPSIEKLTEYIHNKNDKYQVEVKHDIIRCVI